MTDKKTIVQKAVEFVMRYKDLRKIDVTKHIEKKGKFNYLSWSHAMDVLLTHDENAGWSYGDYLTLPDGSMMVFCTVTAFGNSRTMQLPVLDYQNKAISNPNAMQLNTAMQRCLAKAIACHGIGLHIYHGEDLPPEFVKPEPVKQAPAKPKPLTPEQQAKKLAGDIIKEISKANNAEVLQDAWNRFEDDLGVLFDASEKAHAFVCEKYHELLNGFKG